MMDSQNNNAWNEWANYVLEISKRHDTEINELFDDYNKRCLDIENIRESKLSKDDFQNFLIKDYVIFKTEIITKARLSGIIYGAIMGGIVSFLFRLLG